MSMGEPITEKQNFKINTQFFLELLSKNEEEKNIKFITHGIYQNGRNNLKMSRGNNCSVYLCNQFSAPINNFLLINIFNVKLQEVREHMLKRIYRTTICFLQPVVNFCKTFKCIRRVFIRHICHTF